MTIYRVEVKGNLTYDKTTTIDDEEGNPIKEVPLTREIETSHTLTADTHAEAKQAFKRWVSEQVAKMDGIAFDGTISAWTVEKTQLLDEAPFSVEVSITKNIKVDF